MPKKRDPNQPTANWTKASELVLIQKIFDYAIEFNGRRPSSVVWTQWAMDLSVQFSQVLTMDQLKTKRERLRRLFACYKALQTTIGLGWDPDSGTVSCSKEYWADFIKVLFTHIQIFNVFCLFYAHSP